MRIISLHVRGFGKIENFDADFSSDLNMVYGLNESGKSTLMAFIKAMLYGLKAGRGNKAGPASGLKRYKPWKGNAYGGYLVFELDNGSVYRIDRDFEAGEVKLFDSSFNNVAGNFSTDKEFSGIAEKLTGINESLFERTVFITQMGTRIDNSESKDLIERISNLSQSGTEDVSYKKADSALKDALKRQVGTERSSTRPLDIINKRIDELNRAKAKITREKEAAGQDRARMQALLIHINKLINKEKLFLKLTELIKINKKLKAMNEKADETKFLKDSAEQCETNLKNLRQDKNLILDMAGNKIKTQNIFGILALLAVIAIASGCYVSGILSPVAAIVPVILAMALLGIRIRYSAGFTRMTDEDREKYTEKINRKLHQQAAALNERIQNEILQYEQFTNRLEKLEHNSGDIGAAAAAKQRESVINDIDELIIPLADSLTAAERMLVNGVREKDSVDDHDINHMLNFISSELQQKRIEHARIEAAISKDLPEEDEKLIEEELIRLMRQKESLEQRGAAIGIAIKTLEEAANHVQKKYIPVMNRVFKNTFLEMTDKKYSDIRAGENLNIMLNDPGTDMIVPVSMLSAGTIDQMYMSLRIAIAKTVLKINEGLPFIMDEPFAQYDDERTINALKNMYEISRQQQVIIFTCKSREADLIGDMYPCKICSLT